ncbi:hypothetical protein IW140_006104 [Coemansia sp. RSA 1813]|nr:hypothetical protein EV178_006077 [Coemansia sp. RSA 1646]KAJ1765967.1 hypothetical protein LPJ74_006116 [Coemansia sp. RSA 1843]KAJ2085888.1 hypothetical protein IW138_006058 [Coemansia sp. RSA 986]KAJ2210712.1 hypothetical protein EV179_006040 [Coemansia sp. RSA 487]KAJ2563445.1 hypothetical protein IW140_006104 [Coemansia sp. RSA 1813]
MGIHTQPKTFLSLQSRHAQQSNDCDGQANSVEELVDSVTSHPFSLPTTPAGYAQRALFATVSRLIACLVNERIVDSYYVDRGLSATSYLLILPRGQHLNKWMRRSVVSQMCHKPVVGKHTCSESLNAFNVKFLDPEDIGAHQWIQHGDCSVASPVLDPGPIMKLVAEWNSYDKDVVSGICCELANSVANQAYAYEHRQPVPDIVASTAIEWEQSIVEGHATHPMHRARFAVPPLRSISKNTDFFHLKLAFVAVPRSEVRVEGRLEELLDTLYRNAELEGKGEQRSQYILDYINRETELVLPVHPFHMPAVLEMFAFARQLPFAVSAEAQASLRTVCPSVLVPLGYDIKLPLGIKVSSALRTITPWSTYVGPRITHVIPDILREMDASEPLLIAGEPASAVSTNPDFDIAKYLSCVIREDPDHICRLRGQRAILAAALTNFNDDGTSTVIQQWKLDTREKRCAFLKNYAEKLFDAFLPPIMNHGFAFESHPQNSLLRVDATSGEIRGFIVRDFGGVKIHRETFRKSTGAYIDMLPDSCTDAQSMYEVYDLAYHTLIQCQLHRLVRALNLHYQGNGWAIVRKAFEQRVPKSHALRCAWYQESFDLKCFITMKVDGLYRDFVYKKVPNVLFYEDEDRGIVFSPAA